MGAEELRFREVEKSMKMHVRLQIFRGVGLNGLLEVIPSLCRPTLVGAWEGLEREGLRLLLDLSELPPEGALERKGDGGVGNNPRFGNKVNVANDA